jgi:hypothetical protein
LGGYLSDSADIKIGIFVVLFNIVLFYIMRMISITEHISMFSAYVRFWYFPIVGNLILIVWLKQSEREIQEKKILRSTDTYQEEMARLQAEEDFGRR